MKKRSAGILSFCICTVVSFLALNIVAWRDSERDIVVRINEHEAQTEQLDLTVTVSKAWLDTDSKGNECLGAQYDFVIENKMHMAFTDWELYITLPGEAELDSSWNGLFIHDGNTIYFVPGTDRDVHYVKAGAKEGFGLVLKSDEVLDIREFRMIGHWDAKLTDYNLFYIWLAVVIIGLGAILWELSLEYKTRKIKERQENDEKIILETMQTIANFVDAKDPYTKGHSLRVAEYSMKIAEKMNMSEEEIRNIGYIGLMHDCGKMGVADQVLTKPDKLTDEEVQIIRMHTVYGGEILKSMTAIRGLRDGAYYHHERYDGNGYPKGLKGEEIPLCARIIGVADSFDAMNADRCYRKHLPLESIIEELRANVGKQFDPDIAKHMIQMLEDGELDCVVQNLAECV